MASFPYVMSPKKISVLFSELRERGKPRTITYNWLAAAGFTSSADRRMVGMLKYLGIVDQSGVPTADYDRIKRQDWESELADIVRSAYSEVFDALPTAHQRSQEDLVNQFRAMESGVDAGTIGRMVSTFRNLVEVADFSERESVDQVPAVMPETHERAPEQERGAFTSKGPVSVNINISLELPVTDKPEVYEHLFRSMSEHLGDLITANDG